MRFSKRTQRLRGKPDPVARRISTDLDAPLTDSTHESANAAHISAADARTRHSLDSDAHVDLAAGEEFIAMQPNEASSPAKRGAGAPDLLTAEERAAADHGP